MMQGEGHFFAFGMSGWLVWLIGAALVVVPFWKLLPRFGVPSWLALFSFIPLVAIILLWVMALRDPAKEAR
ncbi:hypothetical protein P2H44_08960 [Albimonas sp. CAU 1670]|uniref:hypothetical protein n=1 Tax=Albimonas sp. CAU 1670 TaxID=3032599 RepID=UPI0023DC5D3A|nr:hypothetical protein [Albimonas sp. CAU 1670]MDF2232680.1 hypothetical protein [Albimonas sp. CAU 1670]